MIFSCRDISKIYGTDVILENVSFILEEKEKCAIVGVNGAGKTTVFKIITGEISSDAGEIFVRKDARIGYLSQLNSFDDNNTVNDELLAVFDALKRMENNMRDMELRMGKLSGADLEELMNRYTHVVNEFEQNKGYEYRSRVKGVIKGLGFTNDEASQLVGTLSGGQKTRVSLGKLLLSEPDILLLDEPTNHLDIESTEWLEDYLRAYTGSVIIISHDRYFLDRIVTKVVEIENKKSTVYNGNYTYFANKKKVDREIWLKHYLTQQKEIKRQEAMIRTIRAYATEKAIIRAKSKEKMLAKMERIDKPEELPDTMRIHLKPNKESGNDVLFVDGVAKSFDGQQIFKGISFDIKKGEKAALIGPNGVGKTTLFRIILGLLDADRGLTREGVNVVVGYYDQEHQNINDDKTLFEEISDAYPKMTYQQIRDTLASFMFTGDDVYKRIGDLSGGERGRVALAKIMLGKSNFLILDEPTNHLDIFSKEILEQALCDYTGTLLYISHDRYFINNTAQKIIEMMPDTANIYLGNYDYYLEKKAEEKLEAKERAEEAAGAALEFSDDSKEGRRRKKEAAYSEKKRQTLLERTEREIVRIEEELKQIDDTIHNDENVYTNAELLGEIYEKRIKLDTELTALYERLIELE